MMPSARNIGQWTFSNCNQLTDLELPVGLETLLNGEFNDCLRLQRIALPLKDDMIDSSVFFNCPVLVTVDLAGGIHDTVASLHLESWRNEMKGEINVINEEATTLLELALWKANLDHNEGGVLEREGVSTTRRQLKRARKEICVTSGASIVIKNVLPFLALKE
eukprot:scaffold23395_cov74-Skeletonema_menzelii.AAC.1